MGTSISKNRKTKKNPSGVNVKDLVKTIRKPHVIHSDLVDEYNRSVQATAMFFPRSVVDSTQLLVASKDHVSDNVIKCIHFMRLVSNASQDCESESASWTTYLSGKKTDCIQRGSIIKLCQLTRVVIITYRLPIQLPSFCTDGDMNMKCYARCVRGKRAWGDTLFCQMCNNKPSGDWLGRLRLGSDLNPEYMEYNVLSNILIVVASLIARHRVFDSEQVAIYDTIIDLPASKKITVKYRTMLRRLFTIVDSCEPATHECQFKEDIEESIQNVETVEQLKTCVGRICLILGVQYIQRAKSITWIIGTISGFKKTELLQLFYKVYRYQALTWEDIDSLVHMLQNSNVLMTLISRFGNQHIIESTGLDLFSIIEN